MESIIAARAGSLPTGGTPAVEQKDAETPKSTNKRPLDEPPEEPKAPAAAYTAFWSKFKRPAKPPADSPAPPTPAPDGIPTPVAEPATAPAEPTAAPAEAAAAHAEAAAAPAGPPAAAPAEPPAAPAGTPIPEPAGTPIPEPADPVTPPPAMTPQTETTAEPTSPAAAGLVPTPTPEGGGADDFERDLALMMDGPPKEADVKAEGVFTPKEADVKAALLRKTTVDLLVPGVPGHKQIRMMVGGVLQDVWVPIIVETPATSAGNGTPVEPNTVPASDALVAKSEAAEKPEQEDDTAKAARVAKGQKALKNRYMRFHRSIHSILD